MSEIYTDIPLSQENKDRNGSEPTLKREEIIDRIRDMIDSLQDTPKWDYVPADETEQGDEDERGTTYENQPRPIRELIAMIAQKQWHLNTARSFYEEALFMARYTDTAPIVPFKSYYPVYAQMSTEQLRAYFTLRTLWRQGKHPEAAPSYLFVYVYETLMKVGVENAEEGYDILSDLRRAYPEINPARSPYMTRWIRDYVVWNGLEKHFAAEFANMVSEDELMGSLAHQEKLDDDRLFDLVTPMSHYRINQSALYKKNPRDVRQAVAFVLRRYIEHSLSESPKNEEKRQETSHTMFADAVFYQPYFKKSASVSITPGLKFVCNRGLWTIVRTSSPFGENFSPRTLGRVLRRADALLRPALGFRPTLSVRPIEDRPIVDEVVKRAVADWAKLHEQARRERIEHEHREQLAQARKNVRIDFSRLGTIRNDAQAVQAALLEGTDDEASQPTVVAPQPAMIPLVTAPKPVGQSDEEQEKALLRLLLDGKDYGEYLRQLRVPPGVMMERINNRFLEELGDTAIEENENGRLVIMDDYREDVEAFCNR